MEGEAGQLAALLGEQFEAATLVWTLHHVDDPEATPRQVGRMLKPGGKVLIGDWVVGEGKRKGDCFRFIATEIERFLTWAGLQNVDLEWVEPYQVLATGEKSAEPVSR